MSRFDLSQTPDFARVTMQDVGAVFLQFYPGQNPAQWNIQEGSYNGVLFHVFTSNSLYQGGLASVTDNGGRRKVKYAFPYRDGQTTDDLGRKGTSYSMEIMIHGPRYLVGLAQLLAQFNLPTPGVLVHPVMGRITVAIEDYQLKHSQEATNAVALSVTFTEHNFTIGALPTTADKTVKSALAKALNGFQLISNAILQVQGTIKFSQSLKNQIVGIIDSYNSQYTTVTTNINQSFNRSGSSDIPTLLPVNQGGLRNPDGSLSSNTFPVGGTLSSVPTSLSSTTPSSAALAANDILKQLNDARTTCAQAITAIQAQGVNALQLHDAVVGLRQTLVLMQDAFEAGVASSQAQVVQYVTPRVMSVREVAFANGLPPSRYGDIVLLNQALLSVNLIPTGTTVQVPIS